MNFQQITKYLDYVRGSRNTSRDKSRGVARPIEKLHYGFTLDAVTLDPVVKATLLQQVNFTMPAAFSILKVEQGSEIVARPAVMCIRYREGSTVYRYRLPSYADPSTNALADAALPFTESVQAPVYAGQIIKPNFCVEYWGFYTGSGVLNSRCASWRYTTSLIVNPTTPDQVSPIIYTTGTVVDRSALVVTLAPEPIPTTYNTAEQWLTN